jgi:serine/threonine protein kinase
VTTKSERRRNYTLKSQPIAVGGQAEVFEAIHKPTGKSVAFKRLVTRAHDAIARLRREIEVQTSIDHPNVMPILDHSDSFQWCVMPLATQVLVKLPLPLANDVVVDVVEHCARGLAEAHSHNFIHRDVTPNNILLLNDEKGERWVVSDWGLVRRHGQTTVVRTIPGQSFGTAGFASPETWADAHVVGTASDVYSLGRVVAWSQSGRWPLPNVPLPAPDPWREFVERTTALDSSERPPTMNHVLDLLQGVRRNVERLENPGIDV